MKKYTIGLDFGSLSCRGILVDTSDGLICAEAVMAAIMIAAMVISFFILCGFNNRTATV